MLTSLDHLLKVLEQQPHWDEYRRYITVCQLWETVVSDKVALHSKPLFIQNNILWVGTSSAAWAQQLSFQGHSLVKKLNNQLSSSPLLKIRFSAAQWSSSQSHPQQLSQNAPISFFAYPDPMETSQKNPLPPLNNPEEAFKRWNQGVQQYLKSLPLCPQCHCPTPSVELDRWSQCYLCVTQHWQTKYWLQSE